MSRIKHEAEKAKDARVCFLGRILASQKKKKPIFPWRGGALTAKRAFLTIAQYYLRMAPAWFSRTKTSADAGAGKGQELRPPCEYLSQYKDFSCTSWVGKTKPAHPRLGMPFPERQVYRHRFQKDGFTGTQLKRTLLQAT